MVVASVTTGREVVEGTGVVEDTVVGVPGAEVVAGAAVMPDVEDTGFANGKTPFVSASVQCHQRKETSGRWKMLFERLMKCIAHHKPVVVASVAAGREVVEGTGVVEDAVVGVAGAGVVVGEAVEAGGDVVAGVVDTVKALEEDITH